MDYYTQLYTMLNKWLGKYGKIIGHDILSSEYRITLTTVVARFTIFYLSTSFLYLIITADTESAVKSMGVIGVNVQVNNGIVINTSEYIPKH